jgi:hypothetical protein
MRTPRNKRKRAKLKRAPKLQILETFGKAVPFGWLMKGPRGREYFAIKVYMDGSLPGQWGKEIRRVDLKTLRQPLIQHFTKEATTAAERGELTTEELEKVLDYLFAELNRRMNRGVV